MKVPEDFKERVDKILQKHGYITCQHRLDISVELEKMVNDIIKIPLSGGIVHLPDGVGDYPKDKEWLKCSDGYYVPIVYFNHKWSIIIANGTNGNADTHDITTVENTYAWQKINFYEDGSWSVLPRNASWAKKVLTHFLNYNGIEYDDIPIIDMSSMEELRTKTDGHIDIVREKII